MNRARLLFVLACLSGLAALSGCSQGSWAWLNPQQKASDSASGASASAIAGLGSGAKSDPKAPKNPFALARLSERQGQTAKAEQLYQEILKKTPNHAGAHHRLGVLYAKQGKMPQAEEHFARALALKPDYAELLSDAGYFYYLTGRMQEAERCLRRALELEPANRKYCNNLALAVAEQGRRDEAYALFRQAGTEKEAAANMAFVLAQQGDYQQALSLYDRVLTEDPTMRVAADAMIELSKRMEQKTQAAPSQGTKEAGPVLASHVTPEASYDAAASRAACLATVSEGRPVPPPWVAGRGPLTGPAEGRPATPPADPNAVRPESFAAVNPASSTSLASEQRPAAGANPGIATGIPCAYIAPGDGPLTRPAALGAKPEATRDALANAVEANPLPAGSRSAGATGSPETRTENRPSPTFSLPHEFFQLSTLALFVGMSLMGTGTIAWLRHVLRQRAASGSHASRPDCRGTRATPRSHRRAAPIAIRRARP